MYAQAERPKEAKSNAINGSLGQWGAVQRTEFEIIDNRPEADHQMLIQEMADNSPHANQAVQLQAMQNQQISQPSTFTPGENNTGLPKDLKTGIESISGYSMDDVKVHYNSNKPAQLQAHAYALGSDIHLASGQEKHLPHEAWHVVQQKQGRVKSTLQMKGGVNINDDQGLEREADIFGKKAQLLGNSVTTENVPWPSIQTKSNQNLTGNSETIQLYSAANNQVLSNLYQIRESPVTTMKNFVARQTGLTGDEVLDDIKGCANAKALKISDAFLDLLDSHEGAIRPHYVKAYVEKTSSGDREDIQGAIGKLGYIEENLRKKDTGWNYDGGHLMRNSFMKWPGNQGNTGKNLAPQDRDENQFLYPGSWNRREEAIKTAIDGGMPMVITSYVSYPTDTYSVSLGHIRDNWLKPGSDSYNEVGNLGTKPTALRVTMHTRTPIQFIIEHHPAKLLGFGGDASAAEKHPIESGDLWLPYHSRAGRLLRGISSPVEDWIFRYMQYEVGRGSAGKHGGALVSPSSGHPFERMTMRAPIETIASGALFAFADYYLGTDWIPLFFDTITSLDPGAVIGMLQNVAAVGGFALAGFTAGRIHFTGDKGKVIQQLLVAMVGTGISFGAGSYDPLEVMEIVGGSMSSLMELGPSGVIQSLAEIASTNPHALMVGGLAALLYLDTESLVGLLQRLCVQVGGGVDALTSALDFGHTRFATLPITEPGGSVFMALNEVLKIPRGATAVSLTSGTATVGSRALVHVGYGLKDGVVKVGKLAKGRPIESLIIAVIAALMIQFFLMMRQ